MKKEMLVNAMQPEESRIAVIEPSNPQGHAIVARIALDGQDHDRAQAAIRRALAIEPEFAPALAELGRAQIMGGCTASG